MSSVQAKIIAMVETVPEVKKIASLLDQPLAKHYAKYDRFFEEYAEKPPSDWSPQEKAYMRSYLALLQLDQYFRSRPCGTEGGPVDYRLSWDIKLRSDIAPYSKLCDILFGLDLKSPVSWKLLRSQVAVTSKNGDINVGTFFKLNGPNECHVVSSESASRRQPLVDVLRTNGVPEPYRRDSSCDEASSPKMSPRETDVLDSLLQQDELDTGFRKGLIPFLEDSTKSFESKRKTVAYFRHLLLDSDEISPEEQSYANFATPLQSEIKIAVNKAVHQGFQALTLGMETNAKNGMALSDLCQEVTEFRLVPAEFSDDLMQVLRYLYQIAAVDLLLESNDKEKYRSALYNVLLFLGEGRLQRQDIRNSLVLFPDVALGIRKLCLRAPRGLSFKPEHMEGFMKGLLFYYFDNQIAGFLFANKDTQLQTRYAVSAFVENPNLTSDKDQARAWLVTHRLPEGE